LWQCPEGARCGITMGAVIMRSPPIELRYTSPSKKRPESASPTLAFHVHFQRNSRFGNDGLIYWCHSIPQKGVHVKCQEFSTWGMGCLLGQRAWTSQTLPLGLAAVKEALVEDSLGSGAAGSGGSVLKVHGALAACAKHRSLPACSRRVPWTGSNRRCFSPVMAADRFADSSLGCGGNLFALNIRLF
jgi:hypothetical protein